MTLLLSALLPFVHAAEPWAVGEVACVTVDTLRLRRAPKPEADVVARMLLGDRVNIVRLGPEASLDGRTDRWLQLANGSQAAWAFGGLLTRSCLDADLDGDARPERVLLATDPSGEGAVAVRTASGWQQVALGPLRTDARAQPEAALDVLPANVAGEPLLRVTEAPDPVTGLSPGVHLLTLAPTLRLALAWSELAESDVYSVSDIVYSPWGPSLTMWRVEGTHLPEGGQREAVTRQWYRLVDGVYEPEGAAASGLLLAPAEP